MIVFTNKGTLDVRAIKTFGVSSKENDNAIGFFGTGLKYAIAVFLRGGCKVAIHTGGKSYKFGTRKSTIRVDEFSIVTMNRRELGFTTELGKTWEPWQAFRELWCNCMDEGGDAFAVADDAVVTTPDDSTVVTVSGPAADAAYANRHETILQSQALETMSPVGELHPANVAGDKFMYYRGIRAYQVDKPTMRTYNITQSMDLTEDRTFKYDYFVCGAVATMWANSDDAEALRKVLTAKDQWWEGRLDFDYCNPGPTFKHVVAELVKEFAPHINASAVRVCHEAVLSSLPKLSIPLNDLDSMRLKQAVQFCRALGYPVDRYHIVVSEFLGQEVLGRAHDGHIYLSKRAFLQGTKAVAGTLFEEYLHLEHQLVDETRTMQNFLIDAVMSLGEQNLGRIL